ncbi:DUF692 domain-containing protein [Luteibacter rhizovicinus]|uniref:MNIO family bufferin maturase n=1 Tax=Luteibacter rhizovicinus TaxID=242606 RepID=UPI001C682705|nr:DUF692 domain-containing protein [Luteibacter rhizovicinus]
MGEILTAPRELGFFEIHAENYMGAGGVPHRQLAAIRAEYPLSVHGVGLSLGSAGPLDEAHLARLVAVVERYEPVLVSEHLAWSTHNSRFLNDLLPVPYTIEALRRVAEHVDHVQNALGRTIALENPSTYLSFAESAFAETDFISEVVRRTGCALLLDVNNVHVRCVNGHTSALAYLDSFPIGHVAEIHLAGHASNVEAGTDTLLIDSHDRPVSEAVWALYAHVIRSTGPIPTVIERDADIPSWSTLRDEALRAQATTAALSAGDTHEVAC